MCVRLRLRVDRVGGDFGLLGGFRDAATKATTVAGGSAHPRNIAAASASARCQGPQYGPGRQHENARAGPSINRRTPRHFSGAVTEFLNGRFGPSRQVVRCVFDKHPGPQGCRM
jgi:hypothetical protein